MLIREIKPDDAEKLINLIKQVESESQYMLFEPGERKMSSSEKKNRIEIMRKSDNSTIFVAEDDHQFKTD
jgi:hypothetical protein